MQYLYNDYGNVNFEYLVLNIESMYKHLLWVSP